MYELRQLSRTRPEALKQFLPHFDAVIHSEGTRIAQQGQGRGMGGVARGQRSRRGADRGRSGAPRGRQQNGGGRHYQGRESSGGGRAGGSTSSLSSMGTFPIQH